MRRWYDVVTNDAKATYLATGEGDIPSAHRLDMIRELLVSPTLWTEPPSTVLDGISAGVTADAHWVPDRGRGPGRRVPLVAKAAGIAAIVILVIGALGLFNRPVPEPDAAATLSGTELMPAASGTATIRDTSSGWAIKLEVEGLPPAPVGSFYQGWVSIQDGEGVSIGTFHLRGGNYPMTLWAGVELSDYPWIWVTLEDEGAGPQASERVLLRGVIELLGD